MLLLLALSQLLDSAILLFVDYNPLFDFVSLFSYNTQQNCVTTVKFGKQLYTVHNCRFASIVDNNPLLDFESLFSYDTQQNCVATVKFLTTTHN